MFDLNSLLCHLAWRSD